MVSFLIGIASSFIGCLLALVVYHRWANISKEDDRRDTKLYKCLYRDEYDEFIKLPGEKD